MGTEYWYNLRTGQVEQGAQSSWKHLLGPYGSYAEAAQAMERVQANNEAWEDEDASEHWQDDGGRSS